MSLCIIITDGERNGTTKPSLSTLARTTKVVVKKHKWKGSDPRLRDVNSSWPQTGWQLTHTLNFKGMLAKKIKICLMPASSKEGQK